MAALLVGANAPPTLILDVDVEGMRNHRGMLHACLTRNPAHFPDCRKDPDALRQSVPATRPHLHFTGFRAGEYALTVLHDENSNGRMDKVVGVPSEGFGFSRNPVVRFSAPRFDQVRIELAAVQTNARVKMHYVL